MSMLTFYPWLHLSTEVKLPEFELLQYARGERPIGEGVPEQETLDSVLAPYRDVGESISEATIMRLGKHDLLADLGDADRDEVFLFSELIKFSGLTKREFFGIGTFYWNSDVFSVIVQSFAAGRGGSAITTRRRDGRTINYISADSFNVPRPEHVSSNLGVQLDEPLLVSLLNARKLESWPHYYEAIYGFNSANTDSNAVPEHMEVVATVGAFERVFDLRRGNENELASAFSKAFVPRNEIVLSDCDRVVPERFRGVSSVREAWIRDFFRLRAKPAHGRNATEIPSTWNSTEHLLLGAFAFPLLVKCRLAGEGVYALTRDDRHAINLFERLASARLLERPTGQGGSHDHAWNRIWGDAAFEDLDLVADTKERPNE